MKKTTSHLKTLWRQLLIGVLLLIATIVIAPQIHVIGDSLHTIANADTVFIALAGLALIASYLAAATSYWALAPKISYWPTVLVQIADGFTNRLLPASIGGIATNIVYLARSQHSKVRAGFIVSLDNTLGFIGHMVLLAVVVISGSQPIDNLVHWHLPKTSFLVAIIVSALVLAYIIISRSAWRIITKNLSSLRQLGGQIAAKPTRLLLAFAASLLTTVTYGLILYSSMLAVNVHLSMLQIFLALTVSVLAIVITPTPGGLGGVELGLAAVLTAMGVEAHQAVSTTIIYRFMTYWLPIVPGFWALQQATRRGYLLSNSN